MSPNETQVPRKRRVKRRRGRTQQKRLLHLGLQAKRIHTNPHEAIFAEQWALANDKRLTRGLNNGHGVLQDLMRVYPKDWKGGLFCWEARWAFWIHQREATIVATVIQWLGTPVGKHWLFEVLKLCGFEVKQIRTSRNLPALKGKESENEG